MQTKLTLTIEESVVVQAKEYAKGKGRSLSDIIENYLRALISPAVAPYPLTPQVKKLRGSISLPAGFNHKQAYSDYLSDKHR